MRSFVLGALGLIAIVACPIGPATAQSSSSSQTIPSHFQTHRIYVTPVTSDGDTLHLYTDTGGGAFPVLLQPTVERLGLPIIDTLSRGKRSMPLTRLPSFQKSGSFPSPQNDRAIVFPVGRQARLLDFRDGMLGQSWFAGRTWTFDYGAEQLLLQDPDAEPPAPTHTVDLGFRTDSTGHRISNHPRIEATIDGTTHSFLFDTGATTVLTDSARHALGGPKRRGSSFVVASVFDRWRKNHPSWRVLEGASPYRGGAPLIRVPAVTIAGHTVGPVWFERRPDRAFERMSASMDQPVKGALGGSLLQYFRVTVSYPGAWASFQRAQ